MTIMIGLFKRGLQFYPNDVYISIVIDNVWSIKIPDTSGIN